MVFLTWTPLEKKRIDFVHLNLQKELALMFWNFFREWH